MERNNKAFADIKLSQCYKDIDQILELIIIIFDIAENKLFSQYDFDKIKGIIPLWISDSGRTPESTMTKEIFEKLKTNCSDELTNRILYWFDLQSPIYALQDRNVTLEVKPTPSHPAHQPRSQCLQMLQEAKR